MVCPICDGKGRVGCKGCWVCHGRGTVADTPIIETPSEQKALEVVLQMLQPGDTLVIRKKDGSETTVMPLAKNVN